jgi:hypothetical protein
MLNYLRIAVSALSLTACVLLVALWVRSYWKREVLCYGGLPYRKSARILESTDGELNFSNMYSTLSEYTGRWLFTPVSPPKLFRATRHSFAGIGFNPNPSPYWSVTIPYWLPVILCAALAVAPWIRLQRWRFSLRTLLIATTLVAAALGVIVYLARMS